MEELQFGQFAISVVLSAILGLIYKTVPTVPDRFKPLIAALIGTGLGILYIPYGGMAWTIVSIVNAVLSGFMTGVGAVGVYELTRGVPLPGSPANPRT